MKKYKLLLIPMLVVLGFNTTDVYAEITAEYTANGNTESVMSDMVEYSYDSGSRTLTLIKCDVPEDVAVKNDELFEDIDGKIKKVIVQDGITRIPNSMFAFLYDLRTVELPPSVNTIGDDAFRACSSLESINLGNVHFIGYGAFSGCKSLCEFDLTSLEEYKGDFYSVGGDIIYIKCGDDTFNKLHDTNIYSLYPKELSHVEIFPSEYTTQAHNGSSGEDTNTLSIVLRDRNGRMISVDNGVIHDASDVLEYTLDSKSHILTIISCDKDGVDFIISGGIYGIKYFANIKDKFENGYVDYDKVAYIGGFDYTIDKVIINDGITNIPSYMFFGLDDLKTVELSSSVVSIGESAFEYCDNLTSINLENVETIGKMALNDCSSITYIDLSSCVDINSFEINRTGSKSITLKCSDELYNSFSSVNSNAELHGSFSQELIKELSEEEIIQQEKDRTQREKEQEELQKQKEKEKKQEEKERAKQERRDKIKKFMDGISKSKLFRIFIIIIVVMVVCFILNIDKVSRYKDLLKERFNKTKDGNDTEEENKH